MRFLMEAFSKPGRSQVEGDGEAVQEPRKGSPEKLIREAQRPHGCHVVSMWQPYYMGAETVFG